MATKPHVALPDGFTDAIGRVIRELRDGAVDLHTGSTSRDISDRYHAAIDAERLMLRTVKQLAATIHVA